MQVLEYSNPLYKRTQNDSSPVGQADPYILEHNGVYYVYATNSSGVVMYKSENLSDFVYCGFVLQVTGQKEFWAPSVIHKDGKFYMHYSSMCKQTDDVHTQNIKVAIADSPDGKFTFIKDVLPPFSIDAHVVKSGDDYFMFYCVNDYNSSLAGTYIVVDKMVDMFSLCGSPVQVVRPSIKEEMFQANRFKEGQDWYTLEGAFYFYENGTHYLMYSGSAFEKPSYFIGYATSTQQEKDLTKVKFNKYPNDKTYSPLLKSNSLVEGMGHNSVIKIGNKYFIVYHGRDNTVSRILQDTRVFRMDELRIDGGKLFVTPTVNKIIKI